MSIPRILLLLTCIALLLPLASCAETIINEMDCGCCLDVEADLKPADSGPVAGEVAEDGGEVAVERWVGQPCAENDECKLGLCITTEFLKNMGVENEDIFIPGGICSMMLCQDDESCGPEATCFDTMPFSGTPLGICLPTCAKMAECRWADGYACYKAPLEPDNPEAGTVTACLPDSLVVAIECDDMHCEGVEPGDGTCDEMADCKWKEDYSCYIQKDKEQGICVPDKTVVAIECEDGSCPLPSERDTEEGE